MIQAEYFLSECKKNGFSLFTGTPCSYLKPFINTVIDDPTLNFMATPNEGDAVALASGAWLSGKKSVVMFQNSGLGNAVNPLTSLNYIMKIPFLGIVTLRGEPGGPADEPQHELMGQITGQILSDMKIPWAYFPTKEDEVAPALKQACQTMEKDQLPFFFIMRKDSVAAYELKTKKVARHPRKTINEIWRTQCTEFTTKRTEALRTIAKYFSDNNSVVLATTGKTGRELFEVEDRPNNLYMVGSMGCAAAMGVGLAKTAPSKNICVIDGDGAILMRLGNLALAGQQQPSNLVHIVLDNGVHDSTGGQQTFSEQIDLAQIASACGYERCFEAGNTNEFEAALKVAMQSKKLSFIRFFIGQGSPKELGRPTVKPYEVAQRLRQFIMSN